MSTYQPPGLMSIGVPHDPALPHRHRDAYECLCWCGCIEQIEHPNEDCCCECVGRAHSDGWLFGYEASL